LFVRCVRCAFVHRVLTFVDLHSDAQPVVLPLGPELKAIE